MEWETTKMEQTREHPSKSEVIGFYYRYGYGGFLFWNWTHGVAAQPPALQGPMLAVKTVNNLECCISRKCL